MRLKFNNAPIRKTVNLRIYPKQNIIMAAMLLLIIAVLLRRRNNTSGLGLAVEVLGKAALEIGCVAHMQVAVVHGEQDIDAVLEFRAI